MVITKEKSTQWRLRFHLRKTIQENDGIPATEEVKMMRYMFKINERYPGGGAKEVLPTVEFTRMLHLKGQGSKLKKSLGRLLATNWRNKVARCKFLGASLYNVNDAAHSQGFWYFALLKCRENHQNTQNTMKFSRNLVKYMSVQHIWNISHLLGLFTFHKLVNLSWNFITETCKQHPKTTGHRLCCEKLGTSHDVKGFAIGSVLERIVVERAMMTSVRKTWKTLVWLALNRSISHKVFPENNHKISLFWPIDWNRLVFPWICLQKFREIWLFSATYQKPFIVRCDPSDLKISWIEVGINLEVNWLCLCDWIHFCNESKAGYDEMFVLTLLF